MYSKLKLKCPCYLFSIDIFIYYSIKIVGESLEVQSDGLLVLCTTHSSRENSILQKLNIKRAQLQLTILKLRAFLFLFLLFLCPQ